MYAYKQRKEIYKPIQAWKGGCILFERNYDIWDREFLGLIFGLTYWRHLLSGRSRCRTLNSPYLRACARQRYTTSSYSPWYKRVHIWDHFGTRLWKTVATTTTSSANGACARNYHQSDKFGTKIIHYNRKIISVGRAITSPQRKQRLSGHIRSDNCISQLEFRWR